MSNITAFRRVIALEGQDRLFFPPGEISARRKYFKLCTLARFCTLKRARGDSELPQSCALSCCRINNFTRILNLYLAYSSSTTSHALPGFRSPHPDAVLVSTSVSLPTTLTMCPQLLTSPDPKPRSLPPVKPPRIIVEHFDIATYKVDQAHGYVEADCQHCGATIKGQKNVTSNFIQHMRRRHHDAYDAFAKSSGPRAKRPRLSTASNSSAPTPAKPSPPNTAPSIDPAVAAANAALQLASPIQPPPPPPVEATTPRSASRPSRPALFPEVAASASAGPRAEMTMETALVSATYRGAVRTSCDFASGLSALTGCQFYIKREDTQVSGTSVFRASYNFLAATPTSRAGLVAAASAALPVSAAAQKFTKPCLVIVPIGTPKSLLRKIAAAEAKYEVGGDTDAEACAIAVAKAAEMNRTYVDLSGPKLLSGCADAVAGYATLALELLQQRPYTNKVFMTGGNALMFSGVSTVLQRLGRGVKLIGVVLDVSLDESHKRYDASGDVASATAAQPIAEDWAAFTEDVVRVGRSEMCAAVKAVFEDCGGAVLEPGGALAVAGAVKYARVYKLSHERLAAVVDTPLREFDRLAMIAARAIEADGSRCTLCVQRRGEAETGNRTGSGLAQLMQELSGTAGGTARVTSIKFGGSWPLLLGLACDETTTAGAHVANLTSLGYGAVDVTGSDLAADEAWAWGKEDAPRQSAIRWGVFRVDVPENTNGVVQFLATERTNPPLGKVALSCDGGGVARLLVAAKGTEWQFDNLEREMAGQALTVTRINAERYGLRVLGCPDPPRPEAAVGEGGHRDVVMGESIEAEENAENQNGVETVGDVNTTGEDNATGQQIVVDEDNPIGEENAAGDGEGLAATAEVGMSFGEGEGEAEVNVPSAAARDGGDLGEDAGEGQDAVPSHAHVDDAGTEHGHSHHDEIHIHDDGLGSGGGNENEGDNDGEEVPPHEHHGDEDGAATIMSEAAVVAAAAAVAAGNIVAEAIEAAPPR